MKGSVTSKHPWSILSGRLLRGILLVSLLIPALKTAGAAPAYELPLRVNCGGGELGDKGGAAHWISDREFVVSGKKYQFPARESIQLSNVLDAAPDEVYRTVRRAALIYRFPKLENGRYLVRLHFADTKPRARRLMEFWLEGVKLIDNLDVAKAAGRVGKAFVHNLVVEVSDGDGLEIHGARGRGDDVFLCGIEIHRASPDAIVSGKAGDGTVPPADLAARLREFAGGPVRLAWTRSVDETDFYASRASGRLFGFDTEDGRGERCLLPELRSYAKPLITEDGAHVVFTDQMAQACFAVSWQGTGLRRLTGGYATDVWRDPATGHDWVYVRTGWHDTKQPIIRCRLDSPEIQETIWNTTPNGQREIAYFQVSPDGRRAADTFPWPNCGLADIGAGDYIPMGGGCWPGLAPDESQRCFNFRGSHTMLDFFDRPGDRPRRLQLATIPGWMGHKLYHPRWSNHVRYITATAPQWMPETELYLGKFDDQFTRIEGWQQVTFNHQADFFGDAWFAGAAASRHTVPVVTPAPGVMPVVPWARGGAGDLFAWENARAKNRIINPDGKVLRHGTGLLKGRARFNPWHGAELVDGRLVADDESAAAVARACAAGDATWWDFTLRASRAAQRGIVAQLGGDATGNRWCLEQREDSLWAVLRHDAAATQWEARLGTIKADQWQRWAVLWSPSGITAWCDGGKVAAVSAPGHTANTFEPVLCFGSSPTGGTPWHGSLDSVQVNRGVPSDETLATDFALAKISWVERTPPETTIVEAELEQSSEAEDPALIQPYSRSLGENLYRVRKTLKGKPPGERIIVLQWVIMDGVELPRPEVEGQRVTLELESVDAHPQLGGEHRSTDLLEFGLPVFYDPNS